MSAVPAGLEQRITDAVRRAQVPARAPQRRALPLWVAGLGTAAAALALFIVLHRNSPRAPASAKVEPAEIAAVFTAVTALPQRLSAAFAPSPTPSAEVDPLRRELDNVKADARSALNFLAENFLPAERPDPTSSLHDRGHSVQGS